MPQSSLVRFLACVAIFLLLYSSSNAQNNTVLFPAKDNTLIESPSGSFSNGAGPFFFAGRVGTQGDLTLRRAVFKFDLASAFPSPIDLQEAELSLYVSRPSDGEAQMFTLHRLLSPWGEGESHSAFGLGEGSSNDDATWIHTFYADSFWVNPGGDYIETPSATLEMEQEGTYIWKEQQGILDDLQFWLNQPDKNYGWILLGNEDGTGNTVKRIGSRENESEEQRPQLSITYLDPALPVELASFEGVVDKNQVRLHWTTLSEVNNAGFQVQQQVDGNSFQQVGFVEGAGTTNHSNTYHYILQNLTPGVYAFRLRQVDFDGAFEHSPTLSLTISLQEERALLETYPTPFNPETTIIVRVARIQDVTVEVFNIQGQRVQQLYSGPVSPEAPFKSRFSPQSLPSGAYFIKAQGAYFTITNVVVYLK